VGVDVGVGVAVPVWVGVGVGVSVKVGSNVSVGVSVAMDRSVDVGVRVKSAVMTGISVSVWVGVGVAVFSPGLVWVGVKVIGSPGAANSCMARASPAMISRDDEMHRMTVKSRMLRRFVVGEAGGRVCIPYFNINQRVRW